MITIFGIRNCDTIRKTLRWFDEQGIDYTFHDYKKAGIDEETLRRWIGRVGWEVLVNRRGTTWRKLPADVRETIDEASAIALMMENPSLIKRPVVERGETVVVGFDPEALAALR